MQRHLDPIEASRVSMFSTLAVAFQGQLNEACLARAFRLLGHYHPVLCGTIDSSELAYLLDVQPEHHPEFIVIDGDERTFWQVANKPWDLTQAVAQLVVIRRNDRGFVALRVNHAISDFAAYIALFSELWRIYSDIVNRCAVSTDPGTSLPVPPSELFRERWAEVEPTTPDAARRVIHPADVCDGVCRRIKLSCEQTSRLIGIARTHDTSVHALVSGAIVFALHLHRSSKYEGPITLQSTLDLRSRVRPRVSATETTNFTGEHISSVNVSNNDTVFTIAKEIKNQLHSAIAQRRIHLISLATKYAEAFDQVNREEIDLWVDNAGVVPEFQLPRDLEITDLVVPWAPGKTKVPAKSFPCTHAMWTHNGQLSIYCVYPSSLEPVIDRFVSQLDMIATSTN